MIRTVTLEDVPLCAAIEARCYPQAEAASAEQIAARARHYPQGFFVAERGGQVRGFINGAASDQDDLADEALKDLVDHDPDGTNLIIARGASGAAAARRRTGLDGGIYRASAWPGEAQRAAAV
jgi:hypothetical protein